MEIKDGKREFRKSLRLREEVKGKTDDFKDEITPGKDNASVAILRKDEEQEERGDD